MGQRSIIRHALMAVTAYLAIGIAVAQSGAPAVSLASAQRGAVAGMNNCQAVMAITHGITQYLGAEDVARQLMEIPEALRTALDHSPKSFRVLLYLAFGV